MATVKQDGGLPTPTFDAFVASLIANGEKSGWDSQNALTGAYGKFQITPTNWRNWATSAFNLADGTAVADKDTPPDQWYPYPSHAHQEAIARWRLQLSWDAHNGDARYVAAMWEGGGVGDTPPKYWPLRQRKYVNRVCVPLGYDAL